MAKKALFFVLLSVVFGLHGNPTQNSKQMILAIAPNWKSTTGFLQRFERKTIKDKWSAVGEAAPVSFGKNGLGWGIGLHDQSLLKQNYFTNDPYVKEGSKRAPAGVFGLTLAFGTKNYKPKTEHPTLPYVEITPDIFGVDDINSQYYNRIVNQKNVKKDWNSAEDMNYYANEGLYEVGVVIEHNYEKPIPGKGSCFFIHIHRKLGSPTAGCTAFAKEQVQEVVEWLNPDKNPIFVQLPSKTFRILQSSWGLPELEFSE